MIYTANAIESLNSQLRKVTKNHGHFPNVASVVKLLLAGDRRHRRQMSAREKERENPPANESRAMRG